MAVSRALTGHSEGRKHVIHNYNNGEAKRYASSLFSAIFSGQSGINCLLAAPVSAYICGPYATNFVSRVLVSRGGRADFAMLLRTTSYLVTAATWASN